MGYDLEEKEETVKGLIQREGELFISEQDTGWKFWSNGRNMIGGKFKVKKPQTRIL